LPEVGSIKSAQLANRLPLSMAASAGALFLYAGKNPENAIFIPVALEARSRVLLLWGSVCTIRSFFTAWAYNPRADSLPHHAMLSGRLTSHRELQ